MTDEEANQLMDDSIKRAKDALYMQASLHEEGEAIHHMDEGQQAILDVGIQFGVAGAFLALKEKGIKFNA